MVSTTAHALCCLAIAAAYTTKIAAPRWRRTTARRAVDLSPFEEEVIRSADDQYPLTLGQRRDDSRRAATIPDERRR